MTDKKSFDNVGYWIDCIQKEWGTKNNDSRKTTCKNIKDIDDDPLAIVLVGNKIDLGCDQDNNNKKKNKNVNININGMNSCDDSHSAGSSNDNHDDDDHDSEVYNPRLVTFEQGLRKAKKYGIKFVETSAKNGKNVNEMFELAVNFWLKKKDDKMEAKLAHS